MNSASASRLNQPREVQDALFAEDSSYPAKDFGFRGPQACAIAQISYRQLDYWARTGLVCPEYQEAEGSGSHRLYSFRDILMLKVVKKLLDAGISLQQIRVAINHLRSTGVTDLTQVTLMSDGISVYECTSDHEIVDLLAGGQGMFAIALSGVWKDVEGAMVTLADRNVHADTPMVDELAAARKRRARSA